jgi:putative transposase
VGRCHRLGAIGSARGRARLLPLALGRRDQGERTLGISDNGCTRRRRTEHKDHVWSYNFAIDETEDGRRLKIMPIVDEYSRECLHLEVERSTTAEDVVAMLEGLFRQSREPALIRSDNGPEFIALAIKQWLKVSGLRKSLAKGQTPP